jgi:hypothetical protein
MRAQPRIAISLYRALDGGPCAELADLSLLARSFVQGQHAAAPSHHQGNFATVTI